MELAADFPVFKDKIIWLCENIDLPDHLDKEVVATGFWQLTGYLLDPDKKQMPDWFKGVIAGGKNDYLVS